MDGKKGPKRDAGIKRHLFAEIRKSEKTNKSECSASEWGNSNPATFKGQSGGRYVITYTIFITFFHGSKTQAEASGDLRITLFRTVKSR